MSINSKLTTPPRYFAGRHVNDAQWDADTQVSVCLSRSYFDECDRLELAIFGQLARGKNFAAVYLDPAQALKLADELRALATGSNARGGV
jgi:hypothetical protein